MMLPIVLILLPVLVIVWLVAGVRFIPKAHFGFVITSGVYPDPNDPASILGAGVHIIGPKVDTLRVYPMRSVAIPITDMSVATKDMFNVTFRNMNLVFRIVNPILMELALESVLGSGNAGETDPLMELARFAIDAVTSETSVRTLEELKAQRSAIAQAVVVSLQNIASGWGIEVERVTLGDMDIPEEVQKAAEMQRMADARAYEIEREAEAEAVAILSKSQAEVTAFLEEYEAQKEHWMPMQFLQMLQEFARHGTPPPFQTVVTQQGAEVSGTGIALIQSLIRSFSQSTGAVSGGAANEES